MKKNSGFFIMQILFILLMLMLALNLIFLYSKSEIDLIKISSKYSKQRDQNRKNYYEDLNLSYKNLECIQGKYYKKLCLINGRYNFYQNQIILSDKKNQSLLPILDFNKLFINGSNCTNKRPPTFPSSSLYECLNPKIDTTSINVFKGNLVLTNQYLLKEGTIIISSGSVKIDNISINKYLIIISGGNIEVNNLTGNFNSEIYFLSKLGGINIKTSNLKKVKLRSKDDILFNFINVELSNIELSQLNSMIIGEIY